MKTGEAISCDELLQLAELATTPEELDYVEQLLRDHAGIGDRVANGWVVRTQQDVADFFGMSIQAIRLWRQQGMPGEENCYDIREIVRWERAQRKVATGQSKSARVIELEERSLELEVAKKELAHRNAQGELVERTTAKAMVSEILNRVRTDIETIPSELGPSIPQEIRAELTHQMVKKLELVLTKMSQVRGTT